jgi:hypothetical protein
MVFILAALAPGTAWGINLIPLLDSELGNRPGVFSYRLRHHDRTKVRGQDTHLTRTAQDIDAFWPVFRTGNNELNLYGGISARELDSGLRFPGSGRELPQNLYRVRLGFGVEHRTEQGWIWGLVSLINSPTDRPFSGRNVVGINSTLILRIPHRGDNAWIFYLNYNSTRSTFRGAPLPGLGYWIEHGKQFRAMIGLPFAVDWRPVPRLVLNATYIPIRNVSAKASYKIGERLRAYTSFSWSHKRYLLSDRAIDDERLYSYEKRITAGLEIRLTKFIRVNLSAGYVFDRYYFFGEGFEDRRNDRVDLENGVVLTATLGFAFKWW